MPTYCYECKKHGEFEEYHSMSDEAKLKFCPLCEKEGNKEEPVQRLISGGSGRGIFQLSLNEFKETLPGEVRNVYERGAKEESFAANFIGKEKYEHSLKVRGKR